MRTSLVLGVAIMALAFSFGRQARAAEDDPDKLFADGNTLMDQSKYAEALAKFEAAQKRDPGVGTQFNIAVCQEKLGRLASAYRNFDDVAKLAHASGKKTREDTALQRLAALTPRLSYFVVSSREAADVLVKIDGAIIDKSAWSFYPVDPGGHRIEATAATKKPWALDIVAPPEGQRADVAIPALEAVHGETQLVTVTRETTNTKRTVGFILGGVGLASLVAAGVTGLVILHDKSTADAHCTAPPNHRCLTPDGQTDQTGIDAVNAGRTLVPINYVAWGVGIAGLGAGAFLILTSGKKDAPPRAANATTTWTPSLAPLPGGAYVGLRAAL